jgi:NAD(P)-dependent dehydrogenase (short-subunit alcohol dehydrogenase family)
MTQEPGQRPPGTESAMANRPDHGEKSYRGHGRLAGKATVVTGGDSGIGKAVAIAFAREGADVLIAYLDEHEDAKDTARLVEEAGQRAVLAAVDLSTPEGCREVVDRAAKEFGRIDVLVNNAAYQMTHESLEEVTDEEWDYTFATNIDSMFRLCRAALPHMGPAGRSSTPRPSTPTSPSRRCCRTPRPRAPSRTSPRGWRRCSASAASGSTAWRRARSGPR